MNRKLVFLFFFSLLLVGSVSAYDFPVGTQAFYPFEQNLSNVARDYFPLAGSASYVSGIYESYSFDGVVGNSTQFLMDVSDNNYYPSFSTCLTVDLLSVGGGATSYRFFNLGFQNTGGVNSNLYEGVSFWHSKSAPATLRVLFRSQTGGRVDVLANTTGIYKMCFLYDRPSDTSLFVMNGVNYSLAVTTETAYDGIGLGNAGVDAVYDNLWIINRSLTTEEVSNYMDCGLLTTCCTPNWSCDGFEDCVYPASSVGCDSVNDLNTCGEVYAGDYSEFADDVCDYSGMAVTVTDDSYVRPRPRDSNASVPVITGAVTAPVESDGLFTRIINWFKGLLWW